MHMSVAEKSLTVHDESLSNNLFKNKNSTFI